MDWTGGYPTEVNYKVGFYRNLAPRHLAMIGLLQGIQPPRSPMTYLELGCGAGLATILLAATNPDDQFIGVDFAPSHIAEANGLAAEAGIANLRFIEASFDDDDLIERLPPCDIVSLHGVYTWVGAKQHHAIQQLLAKRLKAGGLFYIAYNNMVASSFEIVLQKALFELSRSGTTKGLKAAFETLKKMQQLGAEHFKQNPAMVRLMAEINEKNPSYLVHEYLTEHWKPYFFPDLARELELSKLRFLGSAGPADNSDEFAASPEMMQLVGTEGDGHVRQFLLDICANRRFRNDIFVKGSRAIEPDKRLRSLRETVFALAKPASDIVLKVMIGRGVLELRRPVFRTIVEHLNDGPKSLGTLNLDDRMLVEAVTLLSHAAIIHPATETPIDARPARRLNAAMFATDYRRAQYGFAAAPRIGSAVPISVRDRLSLAQSLQSDARRSAASVPNDVDVFWRNLQIVD